MDGGPGRRPPYVAVFALLEWAKADWTLLDGRLQQNGVDIYERARLPLFRFVALLHSLVVDRTEWMEEDKRKEILALLEWPQVRDLRDLEEQTDQARATAAQLGLDLPFL